MKIYHICYAAVTIEVIAPTLRQAMAQVPDKYQTQEVLGIKEG